MKFFLFLLLETLVFAQENRDEVINSIFLSSNSSFDDFLSNFEEVTKAPLKSLGALTKCGEGDQENKFVCVPYYNCDPKTNTVQENPETDGTNKIDIRMGEGDEKKCDHYLETCCQISIDINQTNNNSQIQSTELPQTSIPIITTTEISTPTVTPSGTRAFCGIRNTKGLDFNLVDRVNEALFGEFPWMVAILRKNPGSDDTLCVCGGSLITPRVVLTGAHCVNGIDAAEIKIRAGEWDTQTENERLPYQERDVVRKITHKDFIKSNLYNDLSLLILDRQLTKVDNVGTICLPKQDQKIISTECFATGWGKTNFGQQGQYAVILKRIRLPLLQNEPCQRALRTTRLGSHFVLHRSFICAGGEKGVDTCTGDGGSPLVCPDPDNPGRYVQAGIVAWGIGCGKDQIPGVYVDVAQFRNWVDLQLQQLGISSAAYE